MPAPTYALCQTGKVEPIFRCIQPICLTGIGPIWDAHGGFHATLASASICTTRAELCLHQTIAGFGSLSTKPFGSGTAQPCSRSIADDHRLSCQHTASSCPCMNQHNTTVSGTSPAVVAKGDTAPITNCLVHCVVAYSWSNATSELDDYRDCPEKANISVPPIG